MAGLKRGEMLGVEGRVGQTLRFLMQLTYVGRGGVRSGVLASGMRVHVMAGTAEVLGRIMLLDDESPIAVGETRVVQVRLERPLPLRAGDHAVILSYSPISLLDGGRVLLSHCRRARALSAGERALYAALETGDVADGVHAWLALQTLPAAASTVAAALDLVAGEVEVVLRGLVDQTAVRELAAGDAVLYADASALDAAMDVLDAALSSMHAAAPKETGFTSGVVAHMAWPGVGNDVAMALILRAARVACAPSTAPRCSTRIPLLRRYAWCARLASVSLPCWTRRVLMRRRFPRWASSCSSIATP